MKTNYQIKLKLTLCFILFTFCQSFSQEIDWGKKKSVVFSLLVDNKNYSNIVSVECSKLGNLFTGSCHSAISTMHSNGTTEYFIFDSEQYYFASITISNNSTGPDGKTLYQTLENMYNLALERLSVNKWIDNSNSLYKEITSMKMVEGNKVMLQFECVKK